MLSSSSGDYGFTTVKFEGKEVNMENPYPSGEVRFRDPVTGGEKGVKIARFSLVPWWPRLQEAIVYGYGAKKYAEDNWRKGYPWRLSLDALHRHISAFESGVGVDVESGLHHLAHSKFHLNTLMEFERLGLGTDDRLKG